MPKVGDIVRYIKNDRLYKITKDHTDEYWWAEGIDTKIDGPDNGAIKKADIGENQDFVIYISEENKYERRKLCFK